MDVAFYRTIIIPIFIFIGIVGNILSIITLSNKHCKKSSYTVFLTALAIADILTLVFVVSDRWVIETFNIPMTVIGPVYCKLNMFFASSFPSISTWTTVLLAIERTFCISRPIQAKSVCKPKNALKTMAVLVTVILLGYSSHYIYGGKLGIRPDHVQPNPVMNATTKLERNDTDKFLCNNLITSSKNISGDKNENIGDGIKNFIPNGCTSHRIMRINNSSLITRSPNNDTQSSANRCTLSRMNENDTFIWASPDGNGNGNGNSTDFVQLGHTGRFIANDDDNSTRIENGKNYHSGHIGRLTLHDGNSTNIGDVETDQSGHTERITAVNDNDSTDIDNVETDQSGHTERTAIDINNSTYVKNGDIDQMETPASPTLNSADTDQNVLPSQSSDCAAIAKRQQKNEPESNNPSILTPSNDPQDKATCVFVSQSYINFYRIFILFDGMLQFFIPVALLICCNTATWIKVYRIAHGPLINTTSQNLRRTRHVIILTSLISITFILTVSPFSILLILDAEMDENIQYPIKNHKNRAVYEFIAECLFLCNPTCNFFLYIISGKRFRNSFKSVFCKPEP